jgi:hypothetical protein
MAYASQMLRTWDMTYSGFRVLRRYATVANEHETAHEVLQLLLVVLRSGDSEDFRICIIDIGTVDESC